MPDQVDEIKAKTDIVSIVGEYLELKKAGRNFRALCPFHSEKTPSFMVSSELQIYKCFGCSKSGDAISFLEEYEGMDFPEALKFLADRVGIKLDPFKGSSKGEKEKIFQINELASYFYTYLLLKHTIGKTAFDYLVKQRKLKPETIRKFKIGYSPNRSFALKSFLLDKKGYQLSDIEKTGIIYVKDGRAFDRFRGRIIFPLFDHRGNIAGFAGRILPGEDRDLAKYINTPETLTYRKGKMLYGLNMTKSDIKKEGYVVLVEGELDMISSWQVGITNCVAIKGSSLTYEQAKLIGHYTEKLVLALDADLAGDNAVRRGIEIAEKEGFEIKVARLSKFKDPDEAARENPEMLKRAIKEAVNIWDFILENIFSRYKGEGGGVKARISKEVVPVLYSIKDKIVQAHYLKVVSDRLSVSLDAVSEQVLSYKPSQTSVPGKVSFSPTPKKERRELLEERILSLAFRHKSKVLQKSIFLDLFSTSLAKRIFVKFRMFIRENEFDPSLFASFLPGELVEGFSDMILKEEEDLKGKGFFEKELELLINELKITDIKEKLEKVGKKIQEFEKQGKSGELVERQKEFARLARELREFEGEEFKGIILSTKRK